MTPTTAPAPTQLPAAPLLSVPGPGAPEESSSMPLTAALLAAAAAATSFATPGHRAGRSCRELR